MFLKLCTEQIQNAWRNPFHQFVSQNTVEDLQTLAKTLKRNYRRLAIWHLKNHSVKKIVVTTTLLALLLRSSPSRTILFLKQKLVTMNWLAYLKRFQTAVKASTKIIINKELTGAKINITDKFGLRLVDIFKSEDHHISSGKILLPHG